MKQYFTPSDEDIEKVLNGIPSLQQILQQIADQFKCNLDFKIPSRASGYYQHNDRIVIHYSNNQATNIIKQKINEWSSKLGISFGKRTHDIGQDQNGKSYGQLMSQNIVKSLIEYSKQGKWNDEQLTQWTLKSFMDGLRNISNL